MFLSLPDRTIEIHGADHAQAVLAFGRAVCLISAPNAALAGGCGWWRAVIEAGRNAFPDTTMIDILDCGTAPGAAMAALRIGQTVLVLSPACPAFNAVSAAAASLGATVLATRPPALDLAQPGALRGLAAYLDRCSPARDTFLALR